MNQINTAILRLVTGNDDLSIAVTMHPLGREFRREVLQYSLTAEMNVFGAPGTVPLSLGTVKRDHIQ